MAYGDLLAALDRRVDELLSPSRAIHSRSVAELAAELCVRQSIEPERGIIAGLAHDLCKEMPIKRQRRLAAKFPGTQKGSSLMADKILHGPAAAVLLRRDFGVEDEDILEAIALHTVGKPGMSELSLILYCADKLEPGRRHVDPTFIERCLAMPPTEMLRNVVCESISWLEETGHVIAPETLVLYSSLLNSVSST
jgi:predicted HD superfamily hydrolase involved in NAD metabolism